MKRKFIRPDGKMTENAVGYIINSTTMEIMFFEILGASEHDKIPALKVKGRELYRRIMIRRCFLVCESEDKQGISEENLKDLIKLK